MHHAVLERHAIHREDGSVRDGTNVRPALATLARLGAEAERQAG